MTNIWDTSALIRRYLTAEPAADRVRQAFQPSRGDTHIISRLVPTEVASALALRVRTGSLTLMERNALWSVFLTHLSSQYELVEFLEPIWALSQDLVFQHAFRAADALHVAVALFLQSQSSGFEATFWTAERQQARAGRDEGLAVEFLA